MTPLVHRRGSEVSGMARLAHDRRGGVALLVGLVAPVLAMALGLGVEVSRWSVAKLELQRGVEREIEHKGGEAKSGFRIIPLEQGERGRACGMLPGEW